jgi:hypothetical protein
MSEALTVTFRIPQPRRAPQAGVADTKANGSSAPSKSDTRSEPPVPRVSRVARQLALGHRIEQMVDNNEVKDHASVARLLGVSRARIAQVTGLALLAPSIQERLLDGSIRLSERTLRRVAGHAVWEVQLALVDGLGATSRARSSPSRRQPAPAQAPTSSSALA